MLRELDRKSVVGALVQSRDVALDDEAGLQVKPLQFGQRPGIEVFLVGFQRDRSSAFCALENIRQFAELIETAGVMRDQVRQTLDDLVGLDPFSLGVEVGDDAMPQDGTS